MSDRLVATALQARAPADDAREILDAGRRAADLTQQLLSFARQQPRRPRVVDLVAVVRNAKKLLRRLLREDVALSLGLGVAQAPVLADPVQLEQVLVNLAVNARDAMPEGGSLFVEISEEEVAGGQAGAGADLTAGRYIALTVRDTGHGIAPEVLGRVFDPFYTTKESGRGTGLGLATVQGIVSQAGGAVLLESEVGVGTTVRILLPRSPAECVEVARADDASDLPRGDETVLVAEDDPHVRTVISRLLRSFGYRVLVATNGAEALRLASGEREAIDLLLADVVMPGLSGVRLAEALLDARPQVAVLYSTGFSDLAPLATDELRSAALLRKPYGQRELAVAVRNALDASGQRQPSSRD